MLGQPTLNLGDSFYLRLDTANDPLTATLTARSINPVSTGLYSLGDGYLVGALDWERINSNTGAIVRVQGLGTTSATSIGTNSSALGCTVQAGNASSTAYIDIGGHSGGLAINTCLAAAAFAASTAANQTCTIEILGTSGTNFGSAVNVLGSAANAIARIQFTDQSSGSMNLGSALIETTSTLAEVIISGDGVFNAGNCRDLGGTITLSADSVVNLGTVLGGTLTISGDSSFNFGTIEATGSAIISGIGSYSMARISTGALDIQGAGCLNLGSIDDSGSTITLVGNNVQNSMSVTGGADVTASVAALGAYIRGVATDNATVSLTGAGSVVQGYFLGRATTTITSSGIGASITATVDRTLAATTPGAVTITSSATGAVVIGAITSNGGGGTGTATLRAVAPGAIAMGSIPVTTSAACTIEALSSGSFVGGVCFTGTARSAGAGSFVWGYVNGTNALIQASGNGSFSHGRVNSTSATISAIGAGSFAGGDVAVATTTISSTGAGAFAHGVAGAVGNVISAGGNGSFAVGDSTAGLISASGVNTAQFGPGTNSIASSCQIGNTTGGTGLWLLAGGVPGAPVNGQIWKTVTTGRVSLRSAGQTISLYQQGAAGASGWVTGGAANAVQDLDTFTGGTGATAYTIGDIVAALKTIGLIAA